MKYEDMLWKYIVADHSKISSLKKKQHLEVYNIHASKCLFINIFRRYFPHLVKTWQNTKHFQKTIKQKGSLVSRLHKLLTYSQHEEWPSCSALRVHPHSVAQRMVCLLPSITPYPYSVIILLLCCLLAINLEGSNTWGTARWRQELFSSSSHSLPLDPGH